MDGGDTATYQYSALNQRVRIDEGGNAEGFIYNQDGQRVSIWNMNSGVEMRGDTYWGGLPVEFYSNGQANYVHADWRGTDQVYTSYDLTVEGSFTGLPFGDGSGATGSGFEPWVSAQMDEDYYNGSDSGTDHASIGNTEAAGTVGYFEGAGDAQGGTVRGGGISLGVGGGGGASATATGTSVHPLAGHKCVNGVLQ